jgi:hypothetical protein
MPRRDRIIFDREPPVWKIRDIIAKLGGVGPTTEKLIAKGFFPPNANTVQGWVNRNSIPGSWTPAVFALAQDAGLIESPMDALVTDFHLATDFRHEQHKRLENAKLRRRKRTRK